MAGPQQRYRGVRQRHWGSWVSEIRHPLSKNRIWLGAFETAEDAARAYDEAAILICGPRARTNFPYNPNASQSSSSKLLSATLTAKLHRCNMASLQMTKPSLPEPQRVVSPNVISTSSLATKTSQSDAMLPEKRPLMEEQETEANFHKHFPKRVPLLFTNMARPQQRYLGVRQRHWGSWVSEIRHPLSKNKIWLGAFETAEDAARAFDEAARLMYGPAARTNFPYNPNESRSSCSKLLSATLTAKLHRCYMASLQMTRPSLPEPQRVVSPNVVSTSSLAAKTSQSDAMMPEKRPLMEEQETEANCVVKKVQVESNHL